MPPKIERSSLTFNLPATSTTIPPQKQPSITMQTPQPDPPPLPKFQSDDIVTQECRDLLPTLPSQKVWLSERLYQYQGHWYRPRYLQGVLNFQRHFEARDTDILLVTNPKSGTTWLKALTFALVNRHRCPVSGNHHPLHSDSPHHLVPFLEIDLYARSQTPDLSNFSSLRLFSTHVPVVSLPESLKTSPCKIVYLCREPKDTLVSLWHFLKRLSVGRTDMSSIGEMCDSFCRGVSMYGPFWDHALGYWEESLRRPNKFLFLKYEEMKEQPKNQLKRLAEFLGCPLSEEEESAGGAVDAIWDLCSFEKLSNLEANKKGTIASGHESHVFFRKGETGDWRNYLTTQMAEKIDQITEQRLKGSGLKL